MSIQELADEVWLEQVAGTVSSALDIQRRSNVMKRQTASAQGADSFEYQKFALMGHERSAINADAVTPRNATNPPTAPFGFCHSCACAASD